MSDDDEQRRRRSERGRKHQERGRQFHRGMAEIRGETAKNGWRHELIVELGPGRSRRHDTARINERGGRDFTEYKGGNKVGGDFTMRQLAKDREILERDINARGTWVLIQGSASREVQKELDALVRDCGGRFRVEEVSRAQAVLARQRGRALERERSQLELFNSAELRMEQRRREREQRERDRERTQEAARRAMERIELERKVREQRAAAERLAVAARQAREAAARGERRPMSIREVADVLAISQPTPGDQSPHRHHPHVQHRSSRARERNSRERDMGRER